MQLAKAVQCKTHSHSHSRALQSVLVTVYLAGIAGSSTLGRRSGHSVRISISIRILIRVRILIDIVELSVSVGLVLHRHCARFVH